MNIDSGKLNALIKKAQLGDRDALSEILYLFSPFVKDVVRYYAMMLSREDREDLYIEGLIGLQRAIMAFNADKGKRFEDLAYISVKNAIFDYLRKRNRKAKLPTVNNGGESSWEDLILFKDDIEEFTKQLSSLEEKVFRLYLKGYSNSEIADKLGITYKSVDNALQRIKKRLKKYFVES
jgi:RNA polymerase sporulation-specific sigma factor